MTGTFRQYRAIKFKPATLETIGRANAVIEEMEAQGFTLTLRQLYYQLVTKNVIANTQTEYNNLQRVISDARIAGLISWTSLEDRGRNLMGHQTFDSPKQAIAEVVKEYKIDAWANQEWRPEVWVEKQAMESVVGRIASELRVDFYATKGYDSMSQSWRAGQRFAGYIRKGQRPMVFHLADHDPSGFDMTADIRSRLEMFVGMPVIVQRLALNRDQVDRYKPPPNPAKETDSRFEGYRAEHGTDYSWELDALEPSVIMTVIRDAVMMVRGAQEWDDAMDQETNDLRYLQSVAGEDAEEKDEDDGDES